MIFKAQKKYIGRHKMLEFLYSKIKYEPIHKIDLKKSKSSFVDMAKVLKIDAILLREYHQGFHTFEKDQVDCFNEDDNFIIGITEPGICAFLDSYWLREGQRELNERIYEKTKWVIPLIALIITAMSLGYSIQTIRQTQTKIDLLEEKIEKLIQSKPLLIDTKK